MSNKLILAIIGLPGCGKTEAINYLMEKLDCPKVYFGNVVMDEVKKRGLEINEANERKIREELRAEFGMPAMAIKSLPKIKEQLENKDIVLVESLYSWEEYLTLKQEFGNELKLLTIYTSPTTRYARLKNRPDRPLTTEEATSRDHAQIENLHQAGPIAMADFTVNNEENIEELKQQIDNIIKTLKPNL